MLATPSFQIGSVPVTPGLVLAPMSGVTDSAFRMVVKRASGDSVGLLVSEFISIELLTSHHMQSAIRMAFDSRERPVCIQLYGSNIDKMAEAARMVEDAGADTVEINCGCPAPKVVRRGGGAGLLRDLPLLGKILSATVSAVSIPVTVKIRNGWCESSINALETLQVAEENGAQAIGVHGRTRMELYRGEADWDIIRQMKAVASIPVLGSGDVIRPEDARERFKSTGCDGILIGRGAIRNPWIFRQITDLLSNKEVFEPTWADKVDLLRYYRENLDQMYPKRVAPGRMKMMLSRLLKGVPEAPNLRIECLRLDTPDAMLKHMTDTLNGLGVMGEKTRVQAA
jgi:tRNA-dihydrouridine synthase B